MEVPDRSTWVWSATLQDVEQSIDEETGGLVAFRRDHTLFLVTQDERLLRVLPESMWHPWYGCAIEAVSEGFVSYALLDKLLAARQGKHIRSRSRVLRLGPAELEEYALPDTLRFASSLP